MADNKNTQYFKVNNETDIAVKDILEAVYIALTEKGYNPVNQIVGYIMSGDPTYVTSYKNVFDRNISLIIHFKILCILVICHSITSLLSDG